MKYTRTDMIKVLTAAGLEAIKARDLTGAILADLGTALAAGRVIELRGFGTFEQRQHKPRTRYNPQTKAPVYVPARRSVFFRPGQELKKAINGKEN